MPDDDTHDDEQQPFKVFQSEDDYQAELAAAVGRARKAGEKDGKKKASLGADERAELEAYRTAQADAERERLEQEGQFKKLEASIKATHQKELDAKEQKAARLRAELATERCDAALLRAAGSAAFNPQQVVKMLRDQVQLDDDGRAIVLNDKGEPRTKTGGELFTPADLVAEFLADDANANLVRASSETGGSGAKGSAGVKGDTQLAALEKEFADLSAEAAKGDPLPFGGKLLKIQARINERKRTLSQKSSVG